MRWFRMHADAVANPKLKLVAFEDRWHFVAICCLKAEGLLDEDRPEGLRERLIAAQLGLTVREADEVRRRLAEVDLIREDWQPKGWSKYQYASDNSTDRVRKHRSKNQAPKGMKRARNVSVTPPDTDTDSDTEKKKTGAKAPRPSVSEVAEYISSRGSKVDPEAFVAFYESNGWKVGKNPMKDWRAAVRTWEKRDAADQRSLARPGRGETIDDKLRRLRGDGKPSVGEPDGGVRGQVLEGIWGRA